jgi:hypothetical protein
MENTVTLPEINPALLADEILQKQLTDEIWNLSYHAKAAAEKKATIEALEVALELHRQDNKLIEVCAECEVGQISTVGTSEEPINKCEECGKLEGETKTIAT